jgi:hypothetical protein
MPQHPRSVLLLLPALSLAACTGAVGSVGGGPGGPGPDPGPGAGTPPGGNGGQQPGPGGGGNPGTNPGPGGGNPGTGQPGTMPPAAQNCAPPPARIWALTPDQYVRSVRGLLPGAAAMFDGEGLAAAIGAQQGFSNVASRLGLTEPYVGILLEQSYKLAAALTATPAQLAPCLGQAARPADACVRDFIAGFGARAFRRDLSDAEVTGLLAQFRATADAGDARAGLRQLLMAVLTSPAFLFRTELGADGAAGPGPITLTAFETASALSYFLTDGPPDTSLLAAAREGALGRPEQIEAHTRRLLGSADLAGGFTKFMAEHFRTRAALEAEKDAMVFPEWQPPLAMQLAGEAEAFVRQVVWGDGKLSTLLAQPSQTAAGGPRAGLFTQRGIQAALAKDNDTDAVGRGVFLREVLLCQSLPPPPENLNVVPPPPDGQRTMRERLAHHSADPTCAVCHAQIDPLGLAFEIYDGLGRHRSTDLGKPIDAAGALTGAAPEGARFNDGLELMKLLGGSPTVAACFVSTMFRYAHGREPGTEDACAIDRLSQRFGGSGGNIVDLAVAVATDSSFIQRRAGGAVGGAP